MYCPKCKSGGWKFDGVVTPKKNTKVIDSRLQSNQTVRRRRQCQDCGYKFITWETLLSPDEIKTGIEIRATAAREMMGRIKTKATIILNILK